MERAPRKCAMCGGDVVGLYSGLRLTLLCAECCATASAVHESSIVREASAIIDYHCREEDLSRLTHLTARLLDDDCVETYYITAEVEYLGNIRKAAEMKKQTEFEEKRRLVLMKRKEETLKRLYITKGEFASENNKTLMIFLLGDYVRQSHPQVCLAEIKARRAAMSRVREIVRNCRGAHPGAAFDFCIQNPKAGSAEFRALKENMKSAFRIEGHRIFCHLTRSERRDLWGTPLQEDVFQSEEGRNLIRRYLTEHVDSEEADAMMEHLDSQRRINRGGDASEVATKLLLFWSERHDPEKRRERLEAAFAEMGRSMPLDMAQCQRYISGKVDYDPEELILLDAVHRRYHVQHNRRLYRNRVLAAAQRVTRSYYMDVFDHENRSI